MRTLSQGQRRCVALARLAAQRDLQPWLLDEPFDALDAAGVELLAGVIVPARTARRLGRPHQPPAVADRGPGAGHRPVA